MIPPVIQTLTGHVYSGRQLVRFHRALKNIYKKLIYAPDALKLSLLEIVH